MATVRFEISMDLDEETFDFAVFITELRKLFFSEGTSQRHILGAYFLGGVEPVFVDVRIRLGRGRFLQVRLKTSNVYYVGFTRGMDDELTTEKWFVMVKNKDELLDISVEEKNLVSLGFSCSYQSGGIGDYVGTEVSRHGMMEALLALYYHDPISPSVDLMKKGCRMIATAICEPLRYFFLEAKIDNAWKEGRAYRFVQDDQLFIQGWGKISKLLREKDPTTEELDQWEARKDDFAKRRLLSWDNRQKIKAEWKDNVEKYCKTYDIGQHQICALLLNEDEEEEED